MRCRMCNVEVRRRWWQNENEKVLCDKCTKLVIRFLRRRIEIRRREEIVVVEDDPVDRQKWYALVYTPVVKAGNHADLLNRNFEFESRLEYNNAPS